MRAAGSPALGPAARSPLRGRMLALGRRPADQIGLGGPASSQTQGTSLSPPARVSQEKVLSHSTFLTDEGSRGLPHPAAPAQLRTRPRPQGGLTRSTHLSRDRSGGWRGKALSPRLDLVGVALETWAGGAVDERL